MEIETEEEKIIADCMCNGILIIDELIKVTDGELIEKAIKNYPIHYLELFEEWLKKDNWREIFQFFVDNNLNCDIKTFINKNEDQIRLIVYNRFASRVTYSEDVRIISNIEYCNLQNEVININIHNIRAEYEKCISILGKDRNRIIQDAKIKKAFEQQNIEWTKPYFIEKLTNGERDMTIINLCVKLENILKSKHYEGDLVDMIKKYSQRERDREEEILLLDKLRMFRNGIVHSGGKDVPLTVEELKKCIDIICDM